MRQNGPQRRGRGRPSGRRGNNNSPNRNYDSSGPDVKIRGTASTVYEKYTALARDAVVSGDRVAAENFYQHAEHYYRVMQTLRQQRQSSDSEQQDKRGRAQQNRDDSNNETAPETEDEKVVLTEEVNSGTKSEPTDSRVGAAVELEEASNETVVSEQEEVPVAPMNPAELAAMSGSGRKAQHTSNTNGRGSDNASDEEPAPRRQPRRRRTARAPKADSDELIPSESEISEDNAEEDVK